MEDIEIMDGGTDDINQNTVYKIEDISDGANTSLPNKFMIEGITQQDQRKFKYPNGCTCAGGSHTLNGCNMNNNISGNDLRIAAVEQKNGNPKSGRSMALFIALAKEWKLHTGYGTVEKTNITLIKERIYQYRPFYTGSNKIDYTAMAKAKTLGAIIKSGPGHIFTLFGWDDDMIINGKMGQFIVFNSLPFFIFYIAYEDVTALYTLINFTTEEEKANLKKIADLKTINYMKEKGYTNGDDLWMNATRGQTAVILGRIRYGKLSEQELMNRMVSDGIWNGDGEDDSIIRNDAFIMISRFTGFKGDDLQHFENLIKKGISNCSRKKDIATREEIILLCGRMLHPG